MGRSVRSEETHARESLEQLLHQLSINSESERRRHEIELAVQVWTVISGDVVHRTPRRITLQPSQTLFDALEEIVPCEQWGVVTTEGRVWYVHNERMQFHRQETQDQFGVLEFSIRHRRPKDAPTILLQQLA